MFAQIIPFSSISYDEEKQPTYADHVERGSGDSTTSICTIRYVVSLERRHLEIYGAHSRKRMLIQLYRIRAGEE